MHYGLGINRIFNLNGFDFDYKLYRTYIENEYIMSCAYDSIGRDEMSRFFYKDFMVVIESVILAAYLILKLIMAISNPSVI